MPLFITTWPDARIANLSYSRKGKDGRPHVRVKCHGTKYYFRSGEPVDIPHGGIRRFYRRLSLLPDTSLIRELKPGNPDDEKLLFDWRVKELGFELPNAPQSSAPSRMYLPPAGILQKCKKDDLVALADDLGLDSEGTTAVLLERIESMRGE